MEVCNGAKRRHQTRLDEPFPALGRATDACGEGFKFQSVLDNFSACGLYVRLKQRVKQAQSCAPWSD
jgi:hypothetical protein